MDQTPDAEIPQGLTPEARRERARFLDAYKRCLEEAGKFPLSILVWGQNPRAETALARKRKEIQDKLISLGHNAMFSEDISIDGDGLSDKTKEFAQAQAAHLILILIEGSPGAQGEAHDVCNHPELAPKVHILIPKEYRGGYSAKGPIQDLERMFGNVYWYNAGEIESAMQKFFEKVERLRFILYRQFGGARE